MHVHYIPRLLLNQCLECEKKKSHRMKTSWQPNKMPCVAPGWFNQKFA